MQYTEEQYAMLAQIEPGILWTDLSQEELFTYYYLDREGLVQPREDLRPDLLTLSEHGKRVLHDFRQRQNQLKEEAEKKAEAKRQQRFENKLSVANLLISLVSFFAGILLEYFFGTVEAAILLIRSLFH